MFNVSQNVIVEEVKNPLDQRRKESADFHNESGEKDEISKIDHHVFVLNDRNSEVCSFYQLRF